MTTCTVIVNDALALLNLNNGILPVKPAHQARAFSTLVDMLKTLRGDGIYLTRQFPASISADLREESWATQGLKEMLANAVAPYLQRPVPGFEDGERVLRNRGRQPIGCAFPETLPMGSGNTGYCSTSWPYTFYSGFDGIEYDVYDNAFSGEVKTFYADFDYDATIRSTTVSSVAWSSIGGAAIGISGQSLSSNLASAVLTFGGSGSGKIKAKATYANGGVKDFLFSIEVGDA